MNVVLVMFRGDGERRSFSLARDMTVIGRREDCDLRIPVGDVSRKHCRFIREGDSLRLEDLGSSNGTFVNGERIQESVVNAGDYIQVGPVQFVLQIDGYPADEDMADPTAIETVESTGEFMALTELSNDPAPESDAIDLPADALEELPEPPTPDFARVESIATEAPTQDIDLGDDPELELTELPTIEEAPLEELPPLPVNADSEDSPPPPPPPPTLGETHALPIDEIPSPGVIAPVPAAAADTEDDGEWNFVLEEAEPETGRRRGPGLKRPARRRARVSVRSDPQHSFYCPRGGDSNWLFGPIFPTFPHASFSFLNAASLIPLTSNGN